MDQLHDLRRGQGGHFVAVFVLEPLIHLLAVRGHGFDQDAVPAHLDDEFGVGMKPESVPQLFGDCYLSGVVNFHNSNLNSEFVMLHASAVWFYALFVLPHPSPNP